MVNTYDGTILGTDSTMRARYQLGDTGRILDDDDETVWLLDQEEIEGMIVAYGYAEGVAQLADGLAVRFAQEPDEYEDEGGVKVRWTERVAQWVNLAKRLRAGDVSTETSIPTGRPLAKALSTGDAGDLR